MSRSIKNFFIFLILKDIKGMKINKFIPPLLNMLEKLNYYIFH
jgi:hypothetical protein